MPNQQTNKGIMSVLKNLKFQLMRPKDRLSNSSPFSNGHGQTSVWLWCVTVWAMEFFLKEHQVQKRPFHQQSSWHISGDSLLLLFSSPKFLISSTFNHVQVCFSERICLLVHCNDATYIGPALPTAPRWPLKMVGVDLTSTWDYSHVVMFRQQKHLVKIRQRLWFCLKFYKHVECGGTFFLQATNFL